MPCKEVLYSETPLNQIPLYSGSVRWSQLYFFLYKSPLKIVISSKLNILSCFGVGVRIRGGYMAV